MERSTYFTCAAENDLKKYSSLIKKFKTLYYNLVDYWATHANNKEDAQILALYKFLEMVNTELKACNWYLSNWHLFNWSLSHSHIDTPVSFNADEKYSEENLIKDIIISKWGSLERFASMPANTKYLEHYLKESLKTYTDEKIKSMVKSVRLKTFYERSCFVGNTLVVLRDLISVLQQRKNAVAGRFREAEHRNSLNCIAIISTYDEKGVACIKDGFIFPTSAEIHYRKPSSIKEIVVLGDYAKIILSESIKTHARQCNWMSLDYLNFIKLCFPALKNKIFYNQKLF